MADDDSPSSSDSATDARPNRWTGAASTWNTLTEQEQGLAASLDQLRNQNLSLHLYSAFGLRQSARKFKESRRKKARDDAVENNATVEDEDEDEGREWAPPKTWTAWPLPPDLVPRAGEHVGPEDPDEVFTLKRKEMPRPSRELEEVMVGVTLKIAKERFESRELVESDDEMPSVATYKPVTNEEGLGELDGEQLLIKESSEPPPKPTILTPIVSANDDRSRELLRPSIRHALSKVDEVLMALHYARSMCQQYNSWSDGNTDSESQASSTYRARSKPRGRPRKFANLASRPKEPVQDNVPQVEIPTRKTSRRGRPKKIHEPLKGETNEEYLVRVARLQKKPLPSFAPPLKNKITVPSDDSTRNTRPRKMTREQLKGPRQRRLGLRDWSEVLGTAALVGFPPEVIARATQRCSNLFGESMIMRTIVEAPFSATNAEHEIIYQPEEIPSFSCTSSENESGQDEPLESNLRIIPGRKHTRASAYQCPVEKCPRKAEGFEYELNLKRHLRKAHKMTEKEADALITNDEATHGAVHVDGFLKPVRPPRRAKRKHVYRTDEERKGSREESDKDNMRSFESNESGLD
jgi:hypothetical protein